MALEDIDDLTEKGLNADGHVEDHKRIVRGLQSMKASLIQGISNVKPYKDASSDPILETPVIKDSPISPIGITKDGKTLIGGSTTAPWQLHYSIDDGQSWSSGLLTTGDVAQFIGAIENNTGELILTYSGTRMCSRTGNWKNRTMAGGNVSNTGVLPSRASGVSPRPQWGTVNAGEIFLVAEYGSKNNSPLTNNARYVYMSKDEGQNWFRIFDLQTNTDGVPTLGITPQTGGYHPHACAYDKWADRIWVTGGDFNDWIVYSDNASSVEVSPSINTVSGSTTITSTESTKTTFAKRHEGMEIRGEGIPAGAIISTVTNSTQAVISIAATVTTTNKLVYIGNIKWEVFHYGRAGLWQVVGIFPTKDGVYFGADGYPTGFHFSSRGIGNKMSRMENVLNTDPSFKTNVGQHLQMGFFRADWIADAPILVTGDSNDTDAGGYLALIHPSGNRAWEIWRDPIKQAYSGIQQIWYTANGNIIGQMKSNRTASGYQIFKVAMPALPSTSSL